MVIPHQTHRLHVGRKSTFHEGPDRSVTHIDFTEPYDEPLRQTDRCGQVAGIVVCDNAVYAATQGPRLETAAKSTIGTRRRRRRGNDRMPEGRSGARIRCALMRRSSVVANYAAGRADSRNGISFDAIQGELHESMEHVRRIIETVVGHGDPASS